MNASAPYRAARESAAWFRTDRITSLEFTGAQRREFLQGQLTCDLSRTGPGDSVRGCLVSAKGRLIAELAVYDRGELLLLLCDRDTADRVRETLGKTVVLAETDMRLPATPRGTLFVTGPDRERILSRFDDLTRVDVVPTPWGALPGVALHGDSAVIDALVSALDGVPRLTEDDFETLRVENGAPRWGRDMDGEAFPLEVRLEDAVSFSKGCFLGQETLSHIKNRGRLNRRLVGLRLEGAAQAGDPVLAEGAPIGKLTSVVASPKLDATLALAMVKDDAAVFGAELAAGGVRASLVELPL
ncbi:MAG: hypothetical protein AUJ52_05400 [Elusimicrobia bacterium CG1_02_63_36]|nr:MAG: hypothetical protein AUJ52_05400 [Elusimicrobia bacterium CG1_02_63_36]PIP81973.1 MAG: hypothetical protein COR54_17435 [Elusimicrobia bacterium CG22_combo_CG10-13_8_21_14_all_63_91]PJA18468.1 MAG: hypothetical protein COX66_01015 [Elusimicrobia bacterium CG_4_10_14_0_2_um_filter_63_34]PJB24509.1 MAG: hypothetical protein CO113_13545 [Elusimicrobia bacterium CG_4_9_14_3_um_filter_62_55]